MRAADVDLASLPDDPAALRALLVAVVAERDALAERNERLRHLLEKLRRMQFGKRSERLPQDQLQLAFEEVEASIAEAAAEAGKSSLGQKAGTVQRRRAGRGRLPAHLPRIEVVLAPEATTCPCCQGPLVEIGADTSERLDVILAQFRVLVTRRPKLACRACPGTVLQEPAPPRLIEGGVPTEATVAHVLVSRYADHLPLYRQSQILLRQGTEIGREVLADWTGTAAHEVVPVVRRMHELLLASPRLFADETTMPVLDPGRGQTKKGYAWAIARDDRPWGGRDPPAVVFRYAPGRGAEYGKDLLRDYGGIVQCDGYGVYKAIASKGAMTLAFCWSHVRREFVPLARGKTAPIAAEALRRIAALYAVEAEVRGEPPDVRRVARQEKSRPLVRFLDDGRIELDNNTVERAIRPLCLSRKNALFASGDDGGTRWAAVASLVETCKLNGAAPQRYLTDVLTRLVGGWPESRIDELMPWCWATPNPG
ncbi:IS66 family transposase [Roseomonas chloroacetimidivorans]|uniref:IS66 family transposase n=1 Tax=Roseomonas chloroacetimidivorans TaxID=1766656 RepID=UPI003C785DE2